MNLKKAWFKPEGMERISRNPRMAGRKAVGGKPLIGPTREIQEMREALGVTQAQLAAALGIRPSMIANLESGRYAAFVLVGIKMYLFFAGVAAQKQMTALYREAKQEVKRFIDFQRDLNAKGLRKTEEAARKERERVDALEQEFVAAEAELKSI